MQNYWIARDFARLDALAEQWRKGDRTQSGYWRLSILYNHLDENLLAENPIDFPLGSDWVVIDKWIAERPRSPTPVIHPVQQQRACELIGGDLRARTAAGGQTAARYVSCWP